MNNKGNLLRRVSIILLFTSMITAGIFDGLYSVTMPVIKNYFGYTYMQQSMMQVISCLFGIMASTIAGWILVKRNYRFTALLAMAVMATACVGFFFAPRFAIIVVVYTVYRFGYSAYNVSTQAMFSALIVTNIATMMNLLHCFYGVGSTIGPLLTNFFINQMGFTWRKTYLLAALLFLLYFAFFFFIKVYQGTPANDTDQSSPKTTITVKQAFKNKTVIMLGVCLGLIGIAELAPTGYGVFYLQDYCGFNPTAAGSIFVSVFSALFTLSRLIIGRFVEKVGYINSIVASLLFGVAVHTVAFTLGGNFVWLITLTGLSNGILWPTLTALCVKIFKHNSGVVSGCMFSISPLISSTIQLIIGQVNNSFGIGVGYPSMMIYSMLGVVAVLVLKHTCKQYQSVEAL